MTTSKTPSLIIMFVIAMSLISLSTHGARAQAAPTCTLVAFPTILFSAGSSTLSWTSSGADSVSIDQGIGTVTPNNEGSITVRPNETTTYLATFLGANGTTTCETTVSVAATTSSPTAPVSPTTTPIFPPTAPSAPNTPTTTSAAYLTDTTSFPAPMVVESDTRGRILIRGIAQSTGMNSIAILTWGGVWTIRTGPAAHVYSRATNMNGDMSAISVGDFVGIDGEVARDRFATVDATLIRDWTTTPYTASTLTADEGAASDETLPAGSTTTPENPAIE